MFYLSNRPHPHNLVGKEGCKKGVCTLEINNPEMKISFSNLGIQCVKKRDIDEALRVREEIRVDPFRSEIKIKLNMNNKLNGTKFLARFDHRNQPSSIDLNSVRLCFQVFLEGSQKGKFTTPLKPVVSEPIFDKKSMSDLVITKLSHCNAPIVGGQEMILLCEKVSFFMLIFNNTIHGYFITNRLPKKIFLCVSLKAQRIIHRGNVMESFNIHKSTNKWLLHSEHHAIIELIWIIL